MKNKKVVIISLIVGIPVLLIAIGVLLYSQSPIGLIGKECDSTPPTGSNNCESVYFGISYKNPTLYCDYGVRPLGWSGGHGTCQFK